MIELPVNKDPSKYYSKVIDESKFKCFEDWSEKVSRTEEKLRYAIFIFGKNLYQARYKKYDLSKINVDSIGTITTDALIVKFKWRYILIGHKIGETITV